MKETPCPMCGQNFLKRNSRHKRCLNCSVKLERETRAEKTKLRREKSKVNIDKSLKGI